MNSWNEKENRIERVDGAYVMKSRDEYWAEPWLKGHKPWVAFVDADPNDDCDNGTALTYQRGNSPLGISRRWKTPEAAMRAIDKEHPLENVK